MMTFQINIKRIYSIGEYIVNYIKTSINSLRIGDTIYFANKDGVIPLKIIDCSPSEDLIIEREYDNYFCRNSEYIYYLDKDIETLNGLADITSQFFTNPFYAGAFYDLLTSNTGRTEKCPEEGSFIAYKKIEFEPGAEGIAVLKIPNDAKRLTTNEVQWLSPVGGLCYPTYKCRADKAKVLQFETIEGVDLNGIVNQAHSKQRPSFKYNLYDIAVADSFDLNPNNTCSHGINFFMNREDAVNY